MPRFSIAALAGLAGLIAATAVATAAEYSTANSLGFTRDGNHFVFEEYGSTDGLGAPYVSLFAIDIARDKWLKGTPVRLQNSEEEVMALEEKLSKQGITDPFDMEESTHDAIDALRAKALQQARPVLKSIGKLYKGDIRVQNPPHELTSDGRYVRFSVPGYRNLINNPPEILAWALTLEETSFPANDDCFAMHDKMTGFSLVLTNEQTGEKTVLNKDARVPKSRGCPLKYYVEQVLVFPRKDGGFSLAVLVRYAKPGFEGPDGRLIAVTRIIDP